MQAIMLSGERIYKGADLPALVCAFVFSMQQNQVCSQRDPYAIVDKGLHTGTLVLVDK